MGISRTTWASCGVSLTRAASDREIVCPGSPKFVSGAPEPFTVQQLCSRTVERPVRSTGVLVQPQRFLEVRLRGAAAEQRVATVDGRSAHGWSMQRARPRERPRLNPREREVLKLLARGYTNREIATELIISVKTASVHVSHILHKLDVPNRLEAAAIAHRLTPGAPARTR
jgi:DNA-binding CsgD family transcriptional regulator